MWGNRKYVGSASASPSTELSGYLREKIWYKTAKELWTWTLLAVLLVVTSLRHYFVCIVERASGYVYGKYWKLGFSLWRKGDINVGLRLLRKNLPCWIWIRRVTMNLWFRILKISLLCAARLPRSSDTSLTRSTLSSHILTSKCQGSWEKRPNRGLGHVKHKASSAHSCWKARRCSETVGLYQTDTDAGLKELPVAKFGSVSERTMTVLGYNTWIKKKKSMNLCGRERGERKRKEGEKEEEPDMLQKDAS